jgi:hypothetical protein
MLFCEAICQLWINLWNMLRNSTCSWIVFLVLRGFSLFLLNMKKFFVLSNLTGWDCVNFPCLIYIFECRQLCLTQLILTEPCYYWMCLIHGYDQGNLSYLSTTTWPNKLTLWEVILRQPLWAYYIILWKLKTRTFKRKTNSCPFILG